MKQRHLEIYNYPGQDFRFNGRQRMSGIYDLLKQSESVLSGVKSSEHSKLESIRSVSSDNCDNCIDDSECIVPEVVTENKLVNAGTLLIDIPSDLHKNTVKGFHGTQALNPHMMGKKSPKRVPKAEVFSSDDVMPTVKFNQFMKQHKSVPGSKNASKKWQKKFRFISSSAKISGARKELKNIPVLKLFSLKHRNEKNANVPHQSFLTINCPSVRSISSSEVV